MKKIKIKALNGYIFVEDYDNTEESDRVKIYDENMAYLDYISLDGLSKEKYNAILQAYEQSTNVEEFLDGFYISYGYCESLRNLLKSIFGTGDWTNDDWHELQHDIATLSEKELLDKYMINKVGDYYFYLGEY